MNSEAGKSIVRFRVKFRDLRIEMDVEEKYGRREEDSEDVR